MDLGIKNKTAIVFGAGSGLGRAMAVSLAREGVQLALCGRTLSNLEETQAMIQKLGGKSICVSWDLANRAVINPNFERIEKELGPIDILINNTGGPPPTTAAGQTAELWLDKFQEMVLSIFMITDRALIGMRDRQWGRILTSTSSGAIAPIPNLAISNILRASLHAWSKTLSRELAPQGITSNIIVPGRIATDRIRFLDESRAKRENKPVEAIMEDSLKGIPMGRLGTADEYGDAAAFLVSKNASYITGSVIRVDGGQINSI
ncbi:MAG: SDR family oxidoreductase [Polynucleobacter sp.]|nr:SDR family oxidoreductase [Polynucleobacter sp.]